MMDFSQIPLKDMELPAAIGWWPLAIGWWVLAIVTTVLLFTAFLYLLKKRQKPKQVAIKELLNIQRRYDKHQDLKLFLVECNILMKRFALTLYPRQEVAALSGKKWLAFLQENSCKVDFDILEILVQGPYQPSVDLNIEELINNCKKWIKHARGCKDV